jgi:hypothetical protein
VTKEEFNELSVGSEVLVTVPVDPFGSNAVCNLPGLPATVVQTFDLVLGGKRAVVQFPDTGQRLSLSYYEIEHLPSRVRTLSTVVDS